MTDIEALVAEYGTVMKAYGRSLGVGDRLIAIDHSGSADRRFEAIRNALTEQAEAFKGELKAYDGMVRELTKTVEDMQAAQSVPVVGEIIGWRWVNADGKPEGVRFFTGLPSEVALRRAHSLGHDAEFVIVKPAHSITAAELATLREKAKHVDCMRIALEHMMDMVGEPPEANCSCHLSPPCNDCVDHGGLRDAFSGAYAAIAQEGE